MPPKAIEPPVLTLVLTVSVPVLLSVVATVPPTVNELPAIVVTPVPMESPPPPELMVMAPNRVVEPTLPEKVTVPVPFAVSVSASLPAPAASIVPPNEIEPPVWVLVLIVAVELLFSTVGTVPPTVNEFAVMPVSPEPIEKLCAPELIVTAPSDVVPPTFPESVTEPELLAVKVSG